MTYFNIDQIINRESSIMKSRNIPIETHPINPISKILKTPHSYQISHPSSPNPTPTPQILHPHTHHISLIQPLSHTTINLLKLHLPPRSQPSPPHPHPPYTEEPGNAFFISSTNGSVFTRLPLSRYADHYFKSAVTATSTLTGLYANTDLRVSYVTIVTYII